MAAPAGIAEKQEPEDTKPTASFEVQSVPFNPAHGYITRI